MKKFAKKLAFVLALTTAVTSFDAPAITTSAASKIVLQSGAAAPSTVYAGHSYSLKVAGTKVKFYSSNKAVATVGATTGKLKAVKAGTVKITAKSKKTGKAVATKTFKVNQRATSVTTDATELNLNAKDTATIKATLAPATSTDAVRFYSSDKTIATVGATSGKVTAVKDGTATIKVYAKATKATANSSKYNKVATVTVNVGAVLDTVAQTSTTELKATFKTDMSGYKLTASDFSIKNKETGATQSVKEVSVSGKEVKVTTYNAIADGKTYTVSYGSTSADFTATDGKVASLAFDTATAPIQTLTKVSVVEKDANGIIVGTYAADKLPNDVTFDTFDVTNGYKTADSVFFYDLTSTAKVKATYHTYTYENGVETGAITTGDVTIAATDKAAVTANGISYTVSKDATVDFKASTYKQNTTVENGVDGYKVFFKVVDAAGKDVTDLSGYTLSSSDTTTLLVASTIDAATSSAEIKTVKEGTVNIVIKDAKGNVIATLPVTVGKVSAPASMSLDKASLTLSNAAAADDKQKVKVTVKDQYGIEESATEYTNNLKVTCTSTTATGVTTASVTENTAYYTQANNTITFKGNGVTAGTYTYKLTYTEGTKVLNASVKVTVKAAGTKITRFAPSIVDADGATVTTISNAVTKSADADKKLSIVFDGYDANGVLVSRTMPGAENAPTIDSIKDANGKDYKTSAYYDTATGTINVTPTVTGVVKQLPVGTYTVKMTYSVKDANGNVTGTMTPSLTLAVTDAGQPKAVLAQTKTTTDKTTFDAIVADTFAFSYDGKNVENKANEAAKWSVVESASDVVKLGNTITFKTIAVDYTLADGTVVEFPITVNKSVYAKAGIAAPSVAPSAAPSESASAAPSESASAAPSESASAAPSESASVAPSESASAAPSESASTAPSESASAAPSESASTTPAE